MPPPDSGLSGLPPLAARLAAFYFAFFAYSAAYVAYFPLYLASRGLSPEQMAFVLALPSAARMFAPAAWGWIADHTGAQRGIVALSCASMAACFAALPFAEGFASIAVLIGVTGIFSAGALPLVEAITLGASGGPARYGPIRLWGSVGFIAVVLAGGAAIDVLPLSILPGAMVACAAASLAVAFSLPRGARHATPPALQLSIPTGAWAVLAGGFCMTIAHGALYAFFTLHLQRIGYSGTAIGVLWTLGVVAEIFVFAFLPALFRRYLLSTILLASFLCAAVRFLAIAWVPDFLVILVAAQILHAATFGSFHAASVAAMHRLFPAAAKARAQAIFSSVSYGAGGAVGALVSGWAWQAGGASFVFSLAALAGLVGAYFAYALKRAGL
jgi:PPP family 3-phenylpropionic acid transporter